MSLLTGGTTIRMQELVPNCAVLTMRMSFHPVSLQGAVTVACDFDPRDREAGYQAVAAKFLAALFVFLW